MEWSKTSKVPKKFLRGYIFFFGIIPPTDHHPKINTAYIMRNRQR